MCWLPPDSAGCCTMCYHSTDLHRLRQFRISEAKLPNRLHWLKAPSDYYLFPSHWLLFLLSLSFILPCYFTCASFHSDMMPEFPSRAGLWSFRLLTEAPSHVLRGAYYFFGGYHVWFVSFQRAFIFYHRCSFQGSLYPWMRSARTLLQQSPIHRAFRLRSRFCCHIYLFLICVIPSSQSVIICGISA